MKKRLDILVAEKTGESRVRSQALIMAGLVYVNGKRVEKSGSEFEQDTDLEIKKPFPYVSRGALKLEKATQEFEIKLKDKVICDVGASTGGFTDYALQAGAKKVYAIDVGYGQLAQKIREDKRVVVMERINIKDVECLPEPIDVFVIDVSFISLKQVFPAVKNIIENCKSKTKNSFSVIALIKPQFEVGKEIADKNKGIITDKNIQLDVVRNIGNFAEDIGFSVMGITESPITGAKGNQEYLIYLLSYRGFGKG